MTIIDELYKFSKSTDKFSYSVLIHSTINQELIETIKKKLENINKKINNSYKKKFINERIYSLITYLESVFKQTDEINSIFLIDKKINQLDFTKSEKNFCKTWNIPKLIFEYDDHFHIDYLTELLSIKHVKTIFKFDKSNYSVVEMDNTKSRTIETHSSLDESSIESMVLQHKPLLLCGLNQILKKLTYLEERNISVEIRNITNEEIMELIQIKIIKENQDKFREEILDNITNPNVQDKIIFGKKEIGAAIQGYMIKKLFINPKMLKILKEKAEPSLLNFEINIVKSIESGDHGYTLNKNYDGMVGLKYY